MLDEYALIPDIFDPSAYSRPGLIDVCLPHLREPLMKEAIVRDMAGDAWRRFIGAPPFTPHRLCLELLRKLERGNRLRSFPRCGAADPTDVSGWCQEAIASNAREALTAVITTHASAALHRRHDFTDIERITAAQWWHDRSPSRTMARSLAAYQQALRLILRHANSAMFIDPNLDPSAYNYQFFDQILALAGNRRPAPRIEIHRSHCLGDGQGRTFPTEAEWRKRFAGLATKAQGFGIQIEVFGWDDFHYRLLITDIIGISVEAGFDTTNDPNAITPWGRLGRQDLDRFTRDYDPAGRPSALRWRIRWP